MYSHLYAAQYIAIHVQYIRHSCRQNQESKCVAQLTYRSISPLTQLLQLLKATRIPSRVHPVLLQRLAVTKIAHGNRRLGAEGDSKRASDRRLEAAARGAVAVLPELGARGRDLAGDAQERRR